jgi:DNA-binding response OmpR family regulator
VSRILIAEDEARIASFVEKGLRAAGFAVTVSADGRDALTQAQTGQFDLMILDVGLPGRDGFDILRTLRGEANPIAVIMLTARDSAADTLHGLEGGADDYMSKPFRFDELLAPGTTAVEGCPARHGRGAAGSRPGTRPQDAPNQR